MRSELIHALKRNIKNGGYDNATIDEIIKFIYNHVPIGYLDKKEDIVRDLRKIYDGKVPKLYVATIKIEHIDYNGDFEIFYDNIVKLRVYENDRIHWIDFIEHVEIETDTPDWIDLEINHVDFEIIKKEVYFL